MVFEMKNKNATLFDQAITNNDIQKELAMNLSDTSAVSEGVMRVYPILSKKYAATSNNYPYQFKRGALKFDTSAKEQKIGLHTIVQNTYTSLIGQQFEKTEKVELLKKVSFTMEALIHKDKDFKVIERQKLLNKMSVIADALSSDEIKSFEDQISERMEKIMAIEAMTVRLRN
jgi:hypothetical protein